MSDLHALGALADPTRRAIYELVVETPRAVSRDDVAERMGIARQTAAYHLDRLADDGFLTVDYVRLSGRSGPGAGRPAKTYRRSSREYSVSLPPRRYLLAASILLEAAKESASQERILEAARRVGSELGSEELEDALAELGYEPIEEDGEIRFLNCPFHALVDQDRSTTCHLNLALIEGVTGAAGDSRTPRLAPEEGYCCVRISGNK